MCKASKKADYTKTIDLIMIITGAMTEFGYHTKEVFLRETYGIQRFVITFDGDRSLDNRSPERDVIVFLEKALSTALCLDYIYGQVEITLMVYNSLQESTLRESCKFMLGECLYSEDEGGLVGRMELAISG